MHTLHSISSEGLQRKQRFASFALSMVWMGASFAVGAAFYRLSLSGEFPTITFVVALIALLASVPVYREKRMIRSILRQRSQ